MASESLRFDLLANDRASRVFDKVGKSAENTESRFAKVGKGLAVAGRLAVRGAAAFGALGVAGGVMGLKTAASLEQADIAFTTMLGSAKRADRFLKQLADFAAKTPFEFPELQTAASSLISAGFEAKKVIPIMTTLGDVTSGMGTGAEGVQRATVALQQMAAAGRITGEDLNQLRDAGVPVFDLLTAATGKSKAAIAAMAQEGKLGKDEMQALFKALESGKGLERFNGLMEKQSQSLNGLWSTFKDTLGMGLARAVEPAIPHIKTALTKASGAIGAVLAGIPGLIDEWGPRIQAAIDAVKVNGAAIAAKIKDGVKLGLRVVGDFVTTIEAAIASGDWTPVGQAVGRALAAAIRGVGDVAAKLTDALGQLFGRLDFVGIGIAIGRQAPAILLGFVAGLLNFDLMGLLNGVVRHWQDILLAAVAIWLTPAKIVGKVGQALARIPLVGRFLEWGLNAIKGFVDGMAGAIGRFFSFLGDAFLGGFRRVFPGIGSSFAEWLRLLPTRIGVAAIEVAEKAIELMQRLRGAIANRIQSVVAAVGQLIGEILKPFANMGSYLLSAGRDFVRGFINGIKGMAGAAASAAADMARSAVSRVKDLLQIFSPSRVTIEIGEFFSQGLGIGIEKGAKVALEAVNGVIDKVKGKLSDLRSQRKQVVSSAHGAVFGALDVGGLGAPGEDGGPAASVTDQLAGFADQAAKFSAALTAAAGKGLDPRLISQVAALGPTNGLTAAQAIAALNAAQVASANNSVALADKFASNVAQTVLTTTSLPQDIAREQGKLDTLKAIREDLKNNPREIRFVINDATDPDKVVAAIRRYVRRNGLLKNVAN